MGCALAPALVASLVELAALDADLGLRLESRYATYSEPGLPNVAHTTAFAEPSAAAVAEGDPLRLTLTYDPRLWSSDVERQTSPFVTHRLEGRLETRRDAAAETRWTLAATASTVTGTIDPLAAPLRPSVGGATGGQVPTTQPFRYEEFWVGFDGQLRTTPRTALTATGGWNLSRSTGADTGLLPPQQRFTAGGGLLHELGERDQLRVDLRGNLATTGGGAVPSSPFLTGFGEGLATWQRRLTPELGGWASVGARLLYSQTAQPRHWSYPQPTGELGLARTGESLGVTASVRASTFVDRYTGALNPAVEGACLLTWHATQSLSVLGSASAGARMDGQTALGRGELRLVWSVGDSLSFDLGAVGMWQREFQTTRPTFFDGGVFVDVAWSKPGVFGNIRPAPAAP